MSTAAQADTINAASTDSAPAMPTPLDNEVHLLRGVLQEVDGTSVWHSTAVVRELNGEDEEALDIVGRKKDVGYSEYLDTLLKRAVLSIGNLDAQAHPAVLDKLILADRNILFLGIVKATYGTTRNIRAVCPACEASNDVVIELDKDFEVQKPDFDLKVPLEVKTSKGVYKVRLPNGEDIIKAQKAKTPAETNTIILASSLVFDENEPDDRVKFAKSLNSGVRRKLIDTLMEIEAGPNLEGVDTHCASCGVEMPILLDWVSLLLG